ncbi:MAG: 2-hydroxy-3-oxopropionate reductase [Bacteroidetes bacterium 43-16]|nr:MAG: 2-hydroxy-3-oxopropionate reductase [Bacteroidetes bacterium 43-16]
MQTEKTGFIGLGNMGHPMAKNLEAAGFPLFVYNRTKEKADDFRERSTVCNSISELVAQCDVIFTMLTNDEAAEQVYREIRSSAELSGKLFVDMSTISPSASGRICEALRDQGAGFLDAPVAGSTQPATEGTLLFMVGGEDASVQRARPYLQKMGKLIKHLGANGKGLSAKLAINYFLSALYQGLAETVLFADQLGIAREDMLELINNSAAGSGATKVKTPLLIQGSYPPAFALELMLKDILLAKDAGADFPLSSVLMETYTNAAQKGAAKDDVIGIINFLKQE